MYASDYSIKMWFIFRIWNNTSFWLPSNCNLIFLHHTLHNFIQFTVEWISNSLGNRFENAKYLTIRSSIEQTFLSISVNWRTEKRDRREFALGRFDGLVCTARLHNTLQIGELRSRMRSSTRGSFRKTIKLTMPRVIQRVHTFILTLPSLRGCIVTAGNEVLQRAKKINRFPRVVEINRVLCKLVRRCENSAAFPAIKQHFRRCFLHVSVNQLEEL